jgi:hypothetical protein
MIHRFDSYFGQAQMYVLRSREIEGTIDEKEILIEPF